jgi:hemolysin activation/secretion protein
MAATYTPIASTTLGAAATSVTFSSIPQTYTDLVLVINSIISSGDDGHGLQFNGDTAGNYSSVGVGGDGSSAYSYRGSNSIKIDGGRTGTSWSNSIFHIINYSNTTTFKSVIARGNNPAAIVQLNSAVWRNTSAITSIGISVYNNQSMSVGTTFNLYGILGANA